MSETCILHQFTNPEYGITSFVTQRAKGFGVSLRDDDCGEYLGIVNIYADEARAIAEALIAAYIVEVALATS